MTDLTRLFDLDLRDVTEAAAIELLQVEVGQWIEDELYALLTESSTILNDRVTRNRIADHLNELISANPYLNNSFAPDELRGEDGA